MSRIGKLPIEIPQGVEIAIDGREVKVKGPKGELQVEVHPHTSIERAENDEGKEVLTVSVQDENDPEDRSLWGLTQRLIANMVTGVTEGYSKQLEFNGVGYKVQVSGNTVKMDVGFSHEVDYELPEGVEAKAEKNVLTVSGIDKQLVGETAARIRKVRPPEPYKGKGIKYVDEVVRRKAGKAAKTSG